MSFQWLTGSTKEYLIIYENAPVFGFLALLFVIY